MDMDQAAVFLAGSVLTMMGFVVIVTGIVIINNILNKYWRPVQFFVPEVFRHNSAPVRFAEPHELDKSNEPKVK
jgi:hypothetical protein